MATVKVQDLSKHMSADTLKHRDRGNYIRRIYSVQIPENAHLYKVEGTHFREIYTEDGDGFGRPGRWFRTYRPGKTDGGYSIGVRMKSRWSGMYYLTFYVPEGTEIRVRSRAAF